MQLRPYQNDLINKKYNRLTIIEKLKRGYRCRCDCGTIVDIKDLWVLKSGDTKSCGCLYKELRGTYSKTHGCTGTPLYKTWKNMRSRCKNPNVAKYQYYGGKGIKVCKEWDDSFEAFKDWSLTHGYSKGLTIDRIDGNKDYSPENCRWVTYKVQNNNLSSNHLITYKGETHSVYDWAERLKINPKTFSERIRRGWTIERAIETPVVPRVVRQCN